MSSDFGFKGIIESIVFPLSERSPRSGEAPEPRRHVKVLGCDVAILRRIGL